MQPTVRIPTYRIAACGKETSVMLPALTSAAMTTHMKIFWLGPAASNQNSGGTSHVDASIAMSRQIVPVLAGNCSAYSGSWRNRTARAPRMKQSSRAAPNHSPNWKLSVVSRSPTTITAAVKTWIATVAGTRRTSASIWAWRTALPMRSRGVLSENRSEHRNRRGPVRGSCSRFRPCSPTRCRSANLSIIRQSYD